MKKLKIVGLLVIMFVSVLYDFKTPTLKPKEKKSYSVVTLEGAFLKTGEYKYEGVLTIEQLIQKVGVQKNANLKCLDLKRKVKDESSIYLPTKNKDAISLNRASQKELMTLKGIGEKTSLKIIEYRKKQRFSCLEDIKNVKGIGEKTFIRLRDLICL